MKLRERDLDPEAKRELEAVDAALEGRPVDAEHAELATFARELAELAPELTPGYAAELDEVAASGFRPSVEARQEPAGHTDSDHASGRGPIAGGLARLRDRIRTGPGPLPVMGGAAAVLLAVAISASVLTSSSDVELDSLSSGGGSAQEEQAPPTDAAAPGSAGTGPELRQHDRAEAGSMPSPGIASPAGRPGREERVQERSASLRLSTDPGDLRQVADDVIGATDRHDGFVESSSVATGEGSQQRAAFALRVPSDQLSPLLAELSELAQVIARNEGSVDITAPFVSAEERFGDARAAVDRLLEELETAESAAEIASLREQLRTARRELAAARAQLRDLKQRAGFSRVDVVVVAQGGGAGWSLDDAVDDAGSVITSIAGAALVALAALVPLALLAGLLWAASSGARRRRRESGLD